MTRKTYTVDVASGGEHYRRTISATRYDIIGDSSTNAVTFYDDTAESKIVAVFFVSKQHSFSIWED